jgi:hypothetical protein
VREMLKSVRDVNLVDVKCVEQYLGYLERKIDFMKQQAGGAAQRDAPTRDAECNEADLLRTTRRVPLAISRSCGSWAMTSRNRNSSSCCRGV